MSVQEVEVLKVYKDGGVQVSNLPKHNNRFTYSGAGYGNTTGSVGFAKDGETVESLKAQIAEENAKREQEQKEREERANAEFNQAIEATRKYRDTIQLIDMFENTMTFKVVINSEKSERIVGIYKTTPKEYYDFDTSDYKSGYEVNLAYNGGRNDSWGTYSSFNAQTAEQVVDKVMYQLYRTW